jgi:ornithine carbamoyltransferase
MTKHLLSIQSLSAGEIENYIKLGAELKASRGDVKNRPLAGQCWAMIFSKSSTRTRVSFEVGVRELGGHVMFLSARELQLGRGEPIIDTARVLGRMLHGAIIRTYDQSDVEAFAEFSDISTINALTDEEHPCQILADLLTIYEKLGGWEGKKVVFLGDGDCNMARSWMWASARLGIELVIAAPEGYQPGEELLGKLAGAPVSCTDDAMAGVEGADVVYTDVWVSMGKEDENAKRIEALKGYQISADLMARANPEALVMHCLPAYREQEITEEILEAHADTIFQQAENRLHAQKAVLQVLGGV